LGASVLITGGSGFLGSHLARRLLDESWDVHVTTRNAEYQHQPGVHSHVCDLSDLDQASSLLQKIEPAVVYHFAGLATARPDLDLVLPTFHSHVTSAVNLLVLAHKHFVSRLVLVGSLNEQLDGAVSSPYGAAKTAVRHYARFFFNLYATPVVVARPFVTFGPHQHESKVLPYVIQKLSNNDVPLINSGDWLADWIYVSDVIDGLLRIATAQDIEGKEFDFGWGELVSLRSMVLRVAELMQTSVEIEFAASSNRPDEPVRKADLSAARTLLGWQPAVSIDAGLARTIESYAQGLS
jgi:UDP-glucose 4-epimerase